MYCKVGNLNAPTIFIVSEYVDPQVNSTGYYWSKIIHGVSAAFSQVAVICPEDSKFEQYTFESSGASVYPIAASSYKKNNLLFRLFGLLNLSSRFFVKILQQVRRNDLIFSGTNPIFLLLCIALSKKFIRFKWVLLVHDVFPNNLAAAGILRKSNYFYQFLDSMFTWAYKSADAIIVIGRDMEALFKKKQITGQLIYQPNWVNKGEIIPINRKQSALIRNLGWDNKVVFQFFGNAGRLQGIDNLLNAITKVMDPRAAFLFIGEGSEFKMIQKFAETHPHKPIALIANKDLISRNAGLAACDVAIVSLMEGMQGIGVPSKSYFSLAADRPLLGVVDVNSEVAQMIRQYDGIGWHCDPDKPKELAALIDTICKIDLSLNIGIARRLMEEKYDEAPAIDRYIATLKLILDDSN
jgi:glycosyltransferase involved in cell wall biosynthesis